MCSRGHTAWDSQGAPGTHIHVTGVTGSISQRGKKCRRGGHMGSLWAFLH